MTSSLIHVDAPFQGFTDGSWQKCGRMVSLGSGCLIRMICVVFVVIYEGGVFIAADRRDAKAFFGKH
jgi:hypothetical protein